MDERHEITLDPTQALIDWKETQGAGMASFIEDLGISPSEPVPEKGLKRVFAYMEIATNAAKNHVELMNKVGEKEIRLLREGSQFKLSARYRPSIKGNTEGISTMEILLDDKPIFHARFMCFDHKEVPFFVITGLQRYTDENLSPVTKSLESKYQAKPPLKTSNPERYLEYVRETERIKKLEDMLGATLPEMAVATCAALAKAHGDSNFLLTKYNNQLWVKWHADDQQKIEIPNVYDPTASFFGMKQSSELPGFWELNTGEQDITYPANSLARSNNTITAISESAYQGLLEIFRRAK